MLDYLSALMAIVLIDLVLAGDNAIMIAMVARKLPPATRRQAILWGTAGAIAVRVAMTAGAVYLLRTPGLMLVGGMALAWIAYKLLIPDTDEASSDDKTPQAKAAHHFWAACRTIVVADFLMGIDNVLGVAGAAKGHVDLVVIGLLISIPIMVVGSRWVLRWLDRFPVIIYIGSAVLALTASKMIVTDPWIRPWFARNEWLEVWIQVILITGVLWAGRRKNRPRSTPPASSTHG
jgi:YjbE family integral membrane protein